MSRGLSRLQLRILGLAVAVSRARNGVPMARTPVRHSDYRVRVVTGVWADIGTPLAAHVLGGVGLRPRGRIGDLQKVWLETTPAALSVRSVMSRALGSLLKRGLLAYKPYRSVEHHLDHGFVLTTTGLAAGLPHEPLVSDLERRLWLLKYGGTKERRPDWCLNELLPSPALALALTDHDRPPAPDPRAR